MKSFKRYRSTDFSPSDERERDLPSVFCSQILALFQQYSYVLEIHQHQLDALKWNRSYWTTHLPFFTAARMEAAISSIVRLPPVQASLFGLDFEMLLAM